MSLLAAIPHPGWMILCAAVVILLPGRNMFHPAVCFRSALLVFAVSYILERYAYAHTAHYSLTGALVMAAVPVFFGVIGLLEGGAGA